MTERAKGKELHRAETLRETVGKGGGGQREQGARQKQTGPGTQRLISSWGKRPRPRAIAGRETDTHEESREREKHRDRETDRGEQGRKR